MISSISNIRLELLDKERLEVLQKLIPTTSGFVLGGGTALALQLVHRKSYDFDFFSSSQIPKKLLEKLSAVLPIENIVVDTLDELTFFTTGNIKITFLYYPFKPLFKHIYMEDGLRLFPIKEIALQKAYTIGRRGEYRDYFDLYTILKNGYISLREIIAGAKQIYGSVFDEKLFLEQLVYYGDLLSFDITPVSKIQLPTPDKVKQYFESLVKTYII
ncbi:MAG: nucleotidyl transferase AbiEii/AbiGii toxin family protein [Candidatus Levybacteria bacterium]|nr:nucleotidyl transferase AbiEii/AbiGii toxin family protein [Candidatus Levybacteria bacterium]